MRLAHNDRGPDKGRPKPRILDDFGRREQADQEALRRLVCSINRFLGPLDELASLVEGAAGEAMHSIASRPMGTAWLLHWVWQRLGIGPELAKLAQARHVPDSSGVAECSFAAVGGRLAQRAELAPLQANILKTVEISPPLRFQMTEPVAPEAARGAP